VDFVTAVDKTQIHGSRKKVEKKELVIPLIRQNEWRIDGNKKRALPRPEDMDTENGDGDNESLGKKVKIDGNSAKGVAESLEDLAIKELLGQPSATNGDEDKPLLLQNQVPNGYEEDDNLDVSLRPDQPTLEDYDAIPIEEFGMAMLRGMGWKKEEGIGLKNKKHVEMIEPHLRPKGLGLGATLSQQAQQDIQNSQANKNREEQLCFKIGAGVQLQRGTEKGKYGKIEAFDEDNNRIMAKMAISGKIVAISKFHVILVKESEYKTKSKVLNYDQYAEYKDKHDKEKERRDREKDDYSRSRHRDEEDRKALKNEDSKSHRSHKNGPRQDDRSRQYDDRYSSKNSDKHSSRYDDEHRSSHPKRTWVRPHLRVRFIDKRHKGGKYYEQKFIVEDVVEVDRFTLRSDSGSLIEDICTSQVETVIPKHLNIPVCILAGKEKGRIGELMEKNKKKQTAVVKLPDGAVYELSFDDICEFVGDPEDYC